MKTLYKTEAYIIGSYNVQEADRILVAYTKDFGRIRLRAISERKIISKLRCGLELFTYSYIEFIQGRARNTVTEAVPQERYANIRRSLLRLKEAWRIAETLNLVLNGEERDEGVWNLVGATLECLNSSRLASYQIMGVYQYFFWNLMAELGYDNSNTQEVQPLIAREHIHILSALPAQSSLPVLLRETDLYWRSILNAYPII